SPASALAHGLPASPELMSEPMPDEQGAFAFAAGESARFRQLLDGKDAVVFGPGVGTSPAVRMLTEWLIATSPLPLVIDADGLNCLATEIGWLREKRAPIVLTPHPGEMARLCSASRDAVQADRVGSARRLAGEHGVTVVLKGARTVIASPEGTVAVNPSGNPGMASGGMGDALAGMIGAVLAQGVGEAEAAEAAVFWHGHGADRIAASRGEAGLLASDVIEELPAALAELQAATFAV
ncbi:MAG: NAD(P)H-hydrate dehydratase, partial [Candidatus Binatia bacterium]